MAEVVRSDGLAAVVAANHLGLGREAQRVATWVEGRGSLLLQDRVLRAGRDEWHLSAPLAVVLKRLDQWYGMTPLTLASPITHEELDRAAIAPDSVARMATLFEDSIHAGTRLDGRWLVPETGGEATLDDSLGLHPAPDPTWTTARQLGRLLDDPSKVSGFYAQHAADMELLDTSGILRSALARLPAGDAAGSARIVPPPAAVSSVRLALVTVVENAASAYGLGPEAQFTLIARRDWCGRYVGRWHTHPPHDVGNAWAGGAEPSFLDMQNAVRDGQFLTLSFQPDGFDLYDAAPLAAVGRVDFALLKVTRYRSPAWRERFEHLHAATRSKAGS